jgi:glutamyl-tRNA reductase
MKLQVVGCSHHASSVAVRERLAFTPAESRAALARWRGNFPGTEAVLLSTCNRVEVYTASDDERGPITHESVVEFLAQCHGIAAHEVFDALFERTGEDAVRHLFTVAASLDSMVVGEPQILAQVKQAYQMANEAESTGQLTNTIFQAAVRVAKRVSTETAINQRRVSIPSVAVGDFAHAIFETFSDKHVLVIGAGEMSEETLVYLRDEGATTITVINRHRERAEALAERFGGRVEPWENLHSALIEADLVISTTSATEPIVSAQRFGSDIAPHRYQRPLFILDLAIPRDFDSAIGDFNGVYLYSIDDLSKACERNRSQRDRELPAAFSIIEDETQRFMTELNHRATGPIIKRWREKMHELKTEEQRRLLNKLGPLDSQIQQEIEQSFDRLVNKLLHPPLESLRDEARHGTPHGLLDAIKRLFQLKD